MHRSIAAVVLDVTPRERLGYFLIAALLAGAAHGSLWLWARHGSCVQTAVAVPRQTVPRPEVDIDLAEPPPPRPRAEAPVDEPARAPVRAVARSHVLAPAPAPTPAAPAAGVIAADPAADAPLDFTAAPIVSGSARGLPGGTNGSAGDGPGAARPGGEAPPAKPARGPDKSTAVTLLGESWSCPWPREADGQPINERTVIIRAVVGADGRAQSVEVVSDPGQGFGPAAAACGMQARYAPARGPHGDPVRARSPPIRVKFTR